jgi:DMSO/TMAO reductase YedYZ molybdopterin-dependent catalytic subunit
MIVIDGLGARRTLEWSQLDALAQGESLVDGTEKLSNKVRGEGVKLAALLHDVDARVTHVMVHDDDKYKACLSLDEAKASAVLAHRLDGAPLPDAMGGPIRLLVPTSNNACMSVKHVARITLLDHAEPDTVPRPTYEVRKT